MAASFDKKTDAETQSPKLQLFKDIMKRETSKFEQQALLKEAERQKKKKHRSLGRASKTTADTKEKSKVSDDKRVVVSRSQESLGAGNLDSDTEAKSTQSKICPLVSYCRPTPTYMGLACSAVAFLTLGTCGYIVACTFTPQTDIVMPSIDYLKKRANVKHDHNHKSGLGEFIGLNNLISRHDWDETNSKNGLVDLLSTDYSERDSDRFNSWAGKIGEQPINKNLKSFYKRLLDTDLQIKQLKKGMVSVPKIIDVNPKNQERPKRSARLKRLEEKWGSRPERRDDQQNVRRDTGDAKITVVKEDGFIKPMSFNKSNPLSYIVERNHMIVQYKTEDPKRKLPKCAHGSTKDQKTHEENLKHPYHKNNERLDRILDQIIGSNINYGDTVEQLFKKKKNKCKHPKINQESKEKQVQYGLLDLDNQTEDPLEQIKKSDIIQGIEASNTDSTDMTDSQADEEFSSQFEEITVPSNYALEDLTRTTTTEGYRVFLGMTTMMDPLKRENKHRSPLARKLLQVEEDEEMLDVGYEDLKEVLADKVEDHDDQDQQPDKRMKREFDSYEYKQPASPAPVSIETTKFSIYNKNWKGAMPLYPDELNVIMSQSGLPGYNMVQQGHPESNLHAVEYIDDYLNKFEKTGKVAQAYSDYGVFDGSSSKGSVLDKTHSTGNRENVNPRNAASNKKMALTHNEVESKPDSRLDHKRNNQLSRVVLTAGRLKRSVASLTEHEAINQIVAIADDIKKKSTEQQAKEKESFNKPKEIKRNVQILGDKTNFTNDESVNPIFGMILGMFSSSVRPAVQVHPDGISKRSNETEPHGRLSRTLLACRDRADNDSNTSDNPTEPSTTCKEGSSSSSGSTHDSDNSTVIIIESATLTADADSASNSSRRSADTGRRSADNSSLVKRQAGRGKTRFWMDMYDDEYGADAVPFDEDADSGKPQRSDLDQKSGSWLGKKMLRFSHRFQRKSSPRDLMEAPEASHRVVKREYTNAPKQKEVKEKMNFKALHSNMKEVCKKAVREVQQSSNKQGGEGPVAAEGGAAGAAAATLMQQLVQLMSDLVDYQVQQRTCRKLPPDLQEFLLWLTAPAPGKGRRMGERHAGAAGGDAGLDEVWKNYMSNDAATATVDPDSARKYEDVAHNIQDLSREYEAMSDSDKKKFAGVKSHLQTQLQFLREGADEERRKRLTDPLRRKRGSRVIHEKMNEGKLKDIRQKRTYMRNSGRQHTRSTASFHEGPAYSLNDRLADDADETNYDKSSHEREAVRRRKNLRDVYYKALSDSRKLTTVKNDAEIVTSSSL